MIEIDKVKIGDLIEIMRLQKITFLSEAELLQNYNIEPLKQNLQELEFEFNRGLLLKAWDDESDSEAIIGSVRGYADHGTLYIGKLMVHPNYQGQGLGTRLLAAMENWFPNIQRFELFTSCLSSRNLELYRKHGYRELRRAASQAGFELVYLEKLNRDPTAC